MLGNRESQNYNENVFKNNLRHAILEQIRSPPEGFSSVVKAHFFYKRESLIKVSSGRTRDTQSVLLCIKELEAQAGHFSSKDIGKLLSEVKSELNKITI